MVNLPYGPLLASAGGTGEETKNLSLRLLHYEREMPFLPPLGYGSRDQDESLLAESGGERLVGGIDRGFERRQVEAALVHDHAHGKAHVFSIKFHRVSLPAGRPSS